jgi:hypothetical protein
MTKFSFDEWTKLYESNPAEFERRRTEFLEQEIMKAPIANRNNLRMLQIQCDALREIMSPMEATAEMSSMMTAKLSELKTSLTQLRSMCEDITNPE